MNSLLDSHQRIKFQSKYISSSKYLLTDVTDVTRTCSHVTFTDARLYYIKNAEIMIKFSLASISALRMLHKLMFQSCFLTSKFDSDHIPSLTFKY